MSKYIGKVIDRMTGETVYTSRPTTWADAQAKAERKAEGVLCGCDGCACGKIRPAGQIDDRYPDGSAIIWGEVDDE